MSLDPLRGRKDFLSGRPQRAIRGDVPIERLPSDPELLAQAGDVRLTLAHACNSKAELCRRHLGLAPPDASTRAGGRKAGLRALAPGEDQMNPSQKIGFMESMN